MDSPTVRLSEVLVTYANGTRALEVPDLVVGHGEQVALVGPSGGGKTTLLNLLTGRLVLDGAAVSGTVEVLGADIHQLRGRARRRHARRVGLVRQDHDLVGPLRVVHNLNTGRLGDWSTWRALRSLAWPLERAEDRTLLELLELDPALLDARVDELSGGQRQRVALARVLRQRPELLLADEPVASLDPTLSTLALGLISSPPAEVTSDRTWTSIVSLHQPEHARRFADRVIGVRAGQVAFDVPITGLHDEMLERIYATPGTGP